MACTRSTRSSVLTCAESTPRARLCQTFCRKIVAAKMTTPDLCSFRLEEDYVFGGRFVLQLDGHELTYKGTDDFDDPSITTTPVTDSQLLELSAILDLLNVWDWRNNYRSEDIGCYVDDGASWDFAATIGLKKCRAAGINAYPAFATPNSTYRGDGRGRLDLLVTGLMAIFGIRMPAYE